MGFHPANYGLTRPFRSPIRSRQATDRQTDIAHHFIVHPPYGVCSMEVGGIMSPSATTAIISTHNNTYWIKIPIFHNESNRKPNTIEQTRESNSTIIEGNIDAGLLDLHQIQDCKPVCLSACLLDGQALYARPSCYRYYYARNSTLLTSPTPRARTVPAGLRDLSIIRHASHASTIITDTNPQFQLNADFIDLSWFLSGQQLQQPFYGPLINPV